MTIVTFILGIILVAAGAGGLAASFNLLPTELGLLYAACGATLVSGGVVTFAIGVAVLRLEALTDAVNFAASGDGAATTDEAAQSAHAEEHVALQPAAVTAEAEAVESADAAPPPIPAAALVAPAGGDVPDEPAIEESVEAEVGGSGGAELELALAETAAPPTLVGRYSAGGADYKIFSDGSIEAETAGGAFRFSSMAEFKSYLASERAS